jgi:hypothetical protein
MAKKPDKKRIIEMADQRALQIDQLLEAFENLIDKNAGILTAKLISGFLDKLDTKNGLLTAEQNLKKIQLIDRVFSEFASVQGTNIAVALLDDMESIMLLNDEYFKELIGGRQIDNKDIKKILRQRLGIAETGELASNGYMMGLLQDETVKREIIDFAYTRMIPGTGFQEFRAGLKDLIQGDEQRLGSFKRFYRNYAFDTYAQADAMNGALYAKKLDLKYFIYNGGIMRDRKGKVRSRKFCVERAGKVFSTEEAAKWREDPDLTAIDNKASYSWQIQRGGHGCRHSIDYISKEVAFAIRPELS